MNEHKRETLEALAAVLPKLTDLQRERLMGYAMGMGESVRLLQSQERPTTNTY